MQKVTQLEELDVSFNETCLNNLCIITREYECYPKFDPTNILYKTFKELAVELKEYGSIVKYIAAHPNIDCKVAELCEHICNKKCNTDEQVCKKSAWELYKDASAIIDNFINSTAVISKKTGIPHDKRRAKYEKKRSNLILSNGFKAYCKLHNIVTIDNVVALQGNCYTKNQSSDTMCDLSLEKLEPVQPLMYFVESILNNISKEVHDWFTSIVVFVNDPIIIKVWFLTKYIYLSTFYDKVSIIPQKMLSSKTNPKELNKSFSESCLTHLRTIVQKYETHCNFNPNNMLYKTFKELYNDLADFGSITKYIYANSDIERLVEEFKDIAFIITEDDKNIYPHAYLGLIDDMTETTKQLYRNKSIPHDKKKVQNAKKDETNILSTGFKIYCMSHNVISVDNIIALQGLNFSEYFKNEEFDKTLFIDISDAIYEWLHSKEDIEDVIEDVNEIKALFLTKYICLSIFYDDITIIN